MAGHGSGYSSTNAYAMCKRERDKALAQAQYWKKRYIDGADAAHKDGFVCGCIVSGALTSAAFLAFALIIF